MNGEDKQGVWGRNWQLALLLLICAILAFAAVVLPLYQPFTKTEYKVGDVAAEDILAPRPIVYESQVLTRRQRDAAAAAVSPVYTQADTNVARRQLERLRAALAYISSVRADAYASEEQKLADIAALEDVSLSQDTALKILALTDARWQTVQQEAIVVLEQVMRNTIREDRLADVRRSVPNFVSLSLPEEQAEIVADLVSAFVAPNSFYSEEQTELARQQAAESIAPVTRSFAEGETIINRGHVINDEDIEALQQLGLAQPERHWQDLLSGGLLVLLCTVIAFVYLRNRPNLTQQLRGVVVIAVLFILFLFGARLTFSLHYMVPFIYPVSAFALTMAVLFGIEPALIFSLLMVVLAAFDAPNGMEIMLYHLLGSAFGMLIPRKEQRITAYIWVGMGVAVAGTLVLFIMRLIDPNIDWLVFATVETAAVLNGVVTAGMTILLQYFIAPLLGLTTPLQLLELSRPDHPALAFLLRNAPGTYQHSLQVANLAEQAAERIGADSLLTRVGALYHDIGKAQNPQFFIENQVRGTVNTHDDLNPSESAAIIIRHVTDGLELAREFRLPQRIRDFIAEHHGTMMTRYQYAQAVKLAGGDASLVDPTLFQYPGPRPQTVETALLMLADGCEARVRAEQPADEIELMRVIKDTIADRVSEEQLSDTDLTLQELNLIAESFASTLRGIYHPRIEYPEVESQAAIQDVPTRPVEKADNGLAVSRSEEVSESVSAPEIGEKTGD